MSTYAVFGMTRHRARESALKTVPTVEKNQLLPESEWLARVEAETDKIMAGTKVIQLSEKFDAPSFAREFLEIAQKSESRDLHLKAYCDTGDKNPKTGRPIIRWITETEWPRTRQVA